MFYKIGGATMFGNGHSVHMSIKDRSILFVEAGKNNNFINMVKNVFQVA